MTMIHVGHDVFQAKLKEYKEDTLVQTAGIYCGAEELYETKEEYTVVSFHPKESFEDGSFDEVAHMVVTLHGTIHYFIEDGKEWNEESDDKLAEHYKLVG